MEQSMDYGKERVVALVDMDCFYVQVEQRINPELKNKPCVVAQYKTWKGGGIIAVSYEARAHGVTRNMWADDAKKLCPDLQVARVRESHGKADLTHYRDASVEVIEVMSRFAVIERASIDEAYMDLSASVKQRLRSIEDVQIEPHLLTSTFVQGYPQATTSQDKTEDAMLDNDAVRLKGLGQWLASLPPTTQMDSADLQLAVGAIIVEEMRAAVEQCTGFQCSAGISHNKVLAKLACGLNKPNRQTVLPLSSVTQLFSSLPISKIRNLGGKLGASITETMEVENIGELAKFTQGQLAQHFGVKTGQWLYDLCRGIEFEPVKPRQLPKSIGCSKNFPGKTSLATKDQVQHWLEQLALELEERLIKDRDMNGRVAKLLTVGVRLAGETKPSSYSRCCALARYEASKISTDSYAIIKSLNCAGNHQQAWSPPLTLLHLSASKFSDAPTASCRGITRFLRNDVISTQIPLSSHSPSASLAINNQQLPTPKRPGMIESFFQNVVKRRQDHVELSEGAENELEDSLPENSASTSSSMQVTSSFFQKKSAEKKHFQSSTTTADGSGVASYQMVEDSCQSNKHAVFHPDKNTYTPTSDGLCGMTEDSSVPESTLSLSSDDHMPCDRCGQEVLAWEMPEHTDYHFAQDLQNSFSSPLPSLSSSNQIPANLSKTNVYPRSKTSPLATGSRKPSSGSGRQAKKPKLAGTVTLDSFFKRS
ncbi:DNA polymerase eta isoform X2 [Alosa sapidissima]|uniref:DNA polymerase eta isoform X2 n=1 Tax=Alosa sapidissima TaxID=34773 RepID=UPI001C096892|nr:DNA polymerase eta isoform X2 [Alosa sapidissima]